MIPKPIYVDRDTEPIEDEALKRMFGLIQQQFDEMLLAFTRIAFGTIENGRRCQNIDGIYVVHTFGGAANTDETINHLLGVIPRGIINIETPLFDNTAPVVGTVTFGSIPPTTTQVTVRCNAASKVATFVLIP